MKRFLHFERLLNLNLKNKLLKNEKLNQNEIKMIWNHINYLGMNPIDNKDQILNFITENIKENEITLENIKEHIHKLQNKRKTVLENVTFYQNLEKYF